MQTHCGPDFFSGNRTRLRDLLGTDEPIIITGNGNMQRGGDEPSQFHQDSTFWYLTGLDAPDLILVMHGYESFVIVPSLSAVRQAFDGSHDVALFAARSGITDFVSEHDGWNRIRGLLQRSNVVATAASLPPYMKHYGLHSLPYRRRLIERLKRTRSGLQITDIRGLIATLRVIKQPEELAALQSAIDITSATLQDLTTTESLQNITLEYQAEAAITFGFRMRGALGHAFSPIVGAGEHTTTLHYLANNAAVQNEDLIVVDIGADVEHYAADISRTISKKPMIGRAAAVFHSVEAVQDYALSLLRPGVLLKDYEQAVETFMGTQLKQLGLITNQDRLSIRQYFPHATSHFLGLDTHDVGHYDKPLQAGMVLTCEPGIYIADEHIGIRIEDDILITETGSRSLSAACPRRLTPVQ